MTATAEVIAARPRTTLVSMLVIAFLCGSTAGALGMKSYAFREAHHVAALKEARENTLNRWKKVYQLSDDQVAKLSLILDDFNKYYDNVVGEGHERILQVLTPEQRRKFENSIHEAY